MKRPTLSFLLLLFALVAAACGSGDDSSVQTDEPTPVPTSTPAVDDGAADGVGDDGAGPDGDVSTTDPDGAGDGDDADGAGDDTTSTDGDDATSTDDDGAADGAGDDGAADDGAADAPPVGDAEVIFAVFTTGGFVPVDVALSEFPQLVVLSDGTAYRPGAQIAVFPPPLTPALERRQLDQAQVDRVRATIEASTAVDPAIDFGVPNVTDVPFTRVSAQIGGSLTEVEAYGLGFDEGIPAEAREARAALSTLVGEITAIVDEATATGVLTKPPALGVLTFPGLTHQENDPVRPWPIDSVPQPEPPGADCVVITGAELDTLWEAAADATTQTPWNIDGETKAVALRPVFPHEEFC